MGSIDASDFIICFTKHLVVGLDMIVIVVKRTVSDIHVVCFKAFHMLELAHRRVWSDTHWSEGWLRRRFVSFRRHSTHVANLLTFG